MSDEKTSVAVVCEKTEIFEEIKKKLDYQYENLEIHHFSSSEEAVKGIFPLKPKLIVTEWDFSSGPSGEEFLKMIMRDKFIKSAPFYILSVLPKSNLDLGEFRANESIQVFQQPVDAVEIAKRAGKDASFTIKNVKYRELSAGEVLFNKGDKADYLCVVQKGELSVYIEKDGKRIELATIGERRVVGEMAFFDAKSERSATVEAKTDSQVIELTIAGFHEYLAKQPPWLKIMVESLVTNLRAANQKLME